MSLKKFKMSTLGDKHESQNSVEKKKRRGKKQKEKSAFRKVVEVFKSNK